jgi:hypothetical protein
MRKRPEKWSGEFNRLGTNKPNPKGSHINSRMRKHPVRWDCTIVDNLEIQAGKSDKFQYFL